MARAGHKAAAHARHEPDRRISARIDPPAVHPDYRSSVIRGPLKPPLRLPYGPGDLVAPPWPALLAAGRCGPVAADLTRQHPGDPLGERIVVEGRVVDSDGRPVPGALVEIWQANAAGRYAHDVDQHPAPLDPNFTGAGLCLTGDDGKYRFVSIKPGAYPWKNHPNAWRPAHIHFSVLGRAFHQRVITQMYFPGDPLLPLDPIFNSIPNPGARDSLIAAFDLALTVPEWALGFRFDIVLGGRARVDGKGGGA